MKKNFIIYIFIIFLLSSFNLFAEREVDINKIKYDEKKELGYVEGEKEPFTGIAKDYYEDKSLKAELTYTNGILEGEAKQYYQSGKLKSTAIFSNGLLNGQCIGYYESGNIEYEENYLDDELNGSVKDYYENGQLKAELNYKNGKLDGLEKEYHQNGQLYIEENYKDGKLEGESTNYDEKGNITSKRIYKDDGFEVLIGDGSDTADNALTDENIENKVKNYTTIFAFGTVIIGLIIFTIFKMFKSFPKTSHLTDEQRSRIFKILMKHDEGNKELFSSYTLNGVGSSYYRVASMMVDNEKVYIYAKMLSFIYLPTPITFGYLFGYSKDHILASYSNATFKEVKKEIEDTVLHI